MRSRAFTVLILLLVLAGPAPFFLVSCGSGGGGPGDSSLTGSSGPGTVAVTIADNPTDDYSAIFVRITEVSLLPGPVVVFESLAGKDVNLLEHRDNNDYLLKVNYNVPPGSYNKIRLRISDIWAEPKPLTAGLCTNNIKLPSSRIDLNPQHPFTIKPGEAVSIRLDIDANKALDLNVAGNSGQCIFRPVIFVDIGEGVPVQTCPQVVAGVITEISYNHAGQPVDFVLERAGNGDRVQVSLTEDVVVFNGDFVDPTVLAPDDKVKVVGNFDRKLKFIPTTIVIGDAFTMRGDVDTAVQFVDDEKTVGRFEFTPFSGEEISGRIDVEIERGNTSILIGCDTELRPEDIQAGMTARVIGKYIAATTGDVLRAVAVFLRPREISGNLLSWNATPDEQYLVMDVDGIEIYVPRLTEPGFPINQFYPIYLEGDGPVPLFLLCDGRQVRLTLDPYASNPLVAQEVRVQAEPPEGNTGTVTRNDAPVLELDSGQDVYVLPGASILDQRPGTNISSVGGIEPGDNIFYHGLGACNGDATADFYGFVVQVVQ